jgi:hypothetical protein
LENLLAAAAGDHLLAAIGRGDGTAVRRRVRRMLDSGDMEPIYAALDAAVAASEESCWALEEALEEEAQRVRIGGAEAALFCIPVMVGSGKVEPLASAAVVAAVAAMAAPGERFVIAGGWVHIGDLIALQATGYRELARDLGSCAWFGGGRTVALPGASFPNYPADPADTRGAFESISPGTGPGRTAVCFVLGAVTRIGPACRRAGGLFDCLVEGKLDEDAMAALAAAMDTAAGAKVITLRPGQPILVAAGASGAVEAAALRERMRVAAIVAGVKPVTHFCLWGDALYLVVTGRGGCVIDSMMICAIGLDPDLIGDIACEHSRGFVQYEDPSSLPSAGQAGLTVH